MIKVLFGMIVLLDVLFLYCSMIVGKRADEELERMIHGKIEDESQTNSSDEKEQE